MATTIDTSKPVWRVTGQLPASDGRRMTCFVNATGGEEAISLAKAEGLATIERVWEIDVETGLRKDLR
jgi:hypothetical protein